MLEAEDPGVPSRETGTAASPSKGCRAAWARSTAPSPERSSVSLPLRLHQRPWVCFITLLPWSSVSPSVIGIQLRHGPA